MPTDLEQWRDACESSLAFLRTIEWNDDTSDRNACDVRMQLEAVLAAQPSPLLNDEDHRECGRCGHTALWHSNFGKGECQVRVGCATGCHEFLEAQPSPRQEPERTRLEAALAALEALQAAGYFLHDKYGESLSTQEFYKAMQIALDAALIQPSEARKAAKP